MKKAKVVEKVKWLVSEKVREREVCWKRSGLVKVRRSLEKLRRSLKKGSVMELKWNLEITAFVNLLPAHKNL
ncbi:MAG: hypothetical protein IPG09_18235 [Ignavibacteria bacterium]|nr:hypothetical protein [Ignavibacteria bacterium]